VNFQEAPEEIQEIGKWEMMVKTINIKNELGELLDTVLERQRDSKFEDIIKDFDL
jgi:hypothetical protein